MRAKSQNFDFLAKYDERLVLLGAQAERYFSSDPAACLTKLRIFAEVLAQEAAAHLGLYTSADEKQVDLVRRLRNDGAFTREVDDVFYTIRQLGNRAVHGNEGTQSEALHGLKYARVLGIWFHRSFGDPSFKPGPFRPPAPPEDATAALKAQVDLLKATLAERLSEAERAREEAEEAQLAAMTAEERAEAAEKERSALEELFDEAAEREAQMLGRLASLQAKATAVPADINARMAQTAKASSELDLDEADTRRLIDQQLRDVGWEVDTELLRYGRGTRPRKGAALAISEWPTSSGPADYALFLGLELVGFIEAKRSANDVRGALEQAKRYSRTYIQKGDEKLAAGAPWRDHNVPFLFATNGRRYLKQHWTRRGIWFLDVRRADNHSRSLDGFYSPKGLKELLKQDLDTAHEALTNEPTGYLGLRDYQLRAIEAVEERLADDQRELLVSMATGTGKTRTCIGLCYRLLKTKRFRRILFLVDRSSLGVQAANAFKSTQLESLQKFGDIFDIKELKDADPESDTKLHLATVQGMVQRILFRDDNVPPVDTYDCIVIDECHRGYVLDRDMSEGELTFRSEDDYISKYRRVLEHFDAVKIGLTATPALHTIQIFGKPVYRYSFREAVVDGWLIDEEPTPPILTKLSRDGIRWKAGEKVETYTRSTGEIELEELPDEVKIDVEHFNDTVLAESFNRVVCAELAKVIDPSLDEKTLVFCVNREHAENVVGYLKEAFAEKYGSVDDDAVARITGDVDRPLEKIQRYKNERMPNVAVTVDLLTTGIDVPRICNLVFLRRVRSRILYEQMKGRATRRADDIGKETFRVYDAVGIREALKDFTQMKPVVTRPFIPFAQLARELAELTDEALRRDVLDQFIAKLGRKIHRLNGEGRERFETAAGTTPEGLLAQLRASTPADASDWLAAHGPLVALLDTRLGDEPKVYIYDGEDEAVDADGKVGGKAPEDYLEGFTRYLRDNLNKVPALSAFRGELAHQDPNDEPASTLLERLRAQRELDRPPKSAGAARRRAN